MVDSSQPVGAEQHCLHNDWICLIWSTRVLWCRDIGKHKNILTARCWHKTWPEGKVRRIGSGLCLSHIHKGAGASLQRHVHNRSSTLLSERSGAAGGQQAEAGSDVLITLRRSCDHVHSTSTPASAFITTTCLDIYVGVFYVWVTERDIGYYFGVRVIFASVTCSEHYQPPPPLACGESGGGDPLLSSNIEFSWLSTDIIPGGRPGGKLWRLSLGHLRSHIFSRENTEDQCMSESSYGDRHRFTVGFVASGYLDLSDMAVIP